MTILVTGATGNAGSAVVAALSAAGMAGRALVRKPVDLPPGIEPVLGDLNQPATFTDRLTGVTGIFLLSGYDGLDELLAGAVRAGVRKVVVLSSSSLAAEDRDNAIAAYHEATEEAVRASGLAWTFLRPNSFMSNTLRWSDQLAAGDEVRVQFPEVPIATIHPGDLGEVAVRSFGTEHDRAVHRLTGPEALTPGEQLEILGQVLGRRLRSIGLSREETHAELHAGMPAPYATAIERFFGDGLVDETTVGDTVPRVLGRPARSFEAWARENAHRFGRPSR